jgi:hypothetical protein
VLRYADDILAEYPAFATFFVIQSGALKDSDAMKHLYAIRKHGRYRIDIPNMEPATQEAFVLAPSEPSTGSICKPRKSHEFLQLVCDSWTGCTYPKEYCKRALPKIEDKGPALCLLPHHFVSTWRTSAVMWHVVANTSLRMHTHKNISTQVTTSKSSCPQCRARSAAAGTAHHPTKSIWRLQ